MKSKKINTFNIGVHLFFILLCACFVLPLALVVSASFTSEEWLVSGNGFSLWPQDFSLAAYKLAFANVSKMVRAYVVTVAQSGIGTVTSCIVAAMAAYPLSRSNFRFQKPVTAIIFFTMLYSAGMIPTYITYSKSYGITDTFWVYVLPGITGGAWYTMIFRTFFKGIPESLFESAHLDGAEELRIFFKIVMPLSTPVFATVGFMTLVAKWNDYMTSMVYIRNDDLYTLQYLLQKLMEEALFLQKMQAQGMGALLDGVTTPTESLKYALCVIAAGPMLAVFPFFQKYFSQGLTIGAVKG